MKFEKGDEVIIERHAHPGSSLWNGIMERTIGRVGKVLNITRNGYVLVELNADMQWTYHPDDLGMIKCCRYISKGRRNV